MKATTIRDLKQGDYFTLKPIEEPTMNQVYVREHYDRSTKMFCAHKFSDICYERFFKPTTIVYVDIYF